LATYEITRSATWTRGLDAGREYGGGTVAVWDRGTYRNLADEDVSAGLRRGYHEGVAGWLEALRCYVLNQIKLNGDQRHWLLVKIEDEDAHADRASRTRPETASASRATAR